MSALEQFDMAPLAAQRADQLSGGQQQRVAIARALVQEPDIILADEPIASLDPRNTRIVMDALLRINRHFGITVICNLHSLDLARSYCDRLIGMSAGRVVFDGAPATLTDHIARELYDLEADEVMGGAGRTASADRRIPALGALPRPEYRVPTRSLQDRNRRNRPATTGGRSCSIVAIILAGAAALAFTVSAASREDWKAKYPELTFAVVPAENASGVTDRYAPFMDYLSKELGVKVKLRIANDYAAVIEGQRAGNIQIA